MSAYRRTPAFILRRDILGESDRRYTVLTPSYGCLTFKVRGAQKITSKLAGTLEPPVKAQLAFVAGRQLHTLIAADTIDVYHTIRSSADRLSQAAFINQTILELVGEGPGDAGVWELTDAVYHELDQQRMVSPVLGAYFVIRLLTLLGLSPRFDRDAVAGSAVRPQPHRFSLHHGGLTSGTAETNALTVSADAIKVLRVLQQGDLETTRRIKAPETVIREVSRVAARLLGFHRPDAAPGLRVMWELAA